MKIIVGLGNPGEKYRLTRHNAGFMAIDVLAEKLGLAWENNKKFKSLIAEGVDLILMKPQTFMNLSGEAVQKILSFYKLLPKNLGLITKKESDLSEILEVIHDDLDIKLGEYKISINSRAAGHNGVQSIINRLKTKNFKRTRLGIKTQLKEKIPGEKFVLQKFKAEELEVIKQTINKITSL